MNREKYALSFQTEIKLELKKIKTLLTLLDNPQNDLRFIHVAGTNGKGSVCAFLEEMLNRAGFRTGRFSSPELLKKNENIRVDNKNISDSNLKRLIDKVMIAACKMNEMPSPFEIICAAGFLYFKENDCDYVILEAGMGGEGDATNIIPKSEFCVLTHIALDHMQYLGNSIKEITKVKSGIIKKNSKVVTLKNNGEFKIIENKCKEVCAELFTADEIKPAGHKNMHEIIEYKGKKVMLSLCGINQVENAALAVKTAELLNIDEKFIIKGLENAKNPGRFERLCKKVYFDGAHNPDGAKTLKKSLDRYIPKHRKTFVMGVMADKNFKEMLKILNDGQSRFAFVNVKNNPRAMANNKMAEVAKETGIKASLYDDVNSALRNINEGEVFICGSLYMYKDIDKSLLKHD